MGEDIKIEDLVCMESPEDVLEEVRGIVMTMAPGFDFTPFQRVFTDIIRLFNGQYPGYRPCNTFFHDLKHTTDCLMAMARLIHGAYIQGTHFRDEDIFFGLVASLMHDTGYIQTEDENHGTGARHTLTHIDRGIRFMEIYFSRNGTSREDFALCRDYLRCTGLNVKWSEIRLECPEHNLLGRMLGTADLLGQMADRTYLERLPFLYREFVEGAVPGFIDEADLLKKTPLFWAQTRTRLANEFQSVDRFMRDHFRAHWDIDRDLYREAVEKNIGYLQLILDHHGESYRDYLRRGPYMKILDELSMMDCSEMQTAQTMMRRA